MKKAILGNLEWYLTIPTQYVFLFCFIKASISDPEVSTFLLKVQFFLLLQCRLVQFRGSVLRLDSTKA